MRFWVKKLLLVLTVASFGFFVLSFITNRFCVTEYQKNIYEAFYNTRYGFWGLVIWTIGTLSFLGFIQLHSQIISRVKRFALSLLLLSVGVIIGFFILTDPYSGIGGGWAHVYFQRSGDQDRNRDVHSITLAAELHRDEVGRYPTHLSELGLEPESIIDVITNREYEYAVSADGQSFVVKALMGNHPAASTCQEKMYYRKIQDINGTNLMIDLDGIVLGLNCDDPAYCMGNFH